MLRAEKQGSSQGDSCSLAHSLCSWWTCPYTCRTEVRGAWRPCPGAGRADLEHALGGLSIQGTGTETVQLSGTQL